MQLILDIEDSKKDIVLNIIKNLKDGIVKNYTLKNSSNSKSHIEFVSKEEEKEIKKALKTLSSDDKKIVSFTKYTIEL